MATVVVFYPNKEPQLYQSVHTPDYENVSGAVINPDIKALENVPKRYWKLVDGKVVEMDQTEKTAVDSALQTARDTAINNFEDLDAFTLAKALVLLNSQSKPTTKANLVAAVKAVR